MQGTAYKVKIYKKQTEEGLQRRCCNYISRTYPSIIYFADASGVKMSDTKRMSMVSMRSTGDRIPDLIIDHSSRGYFGARFEVKPEGTILYKKDGTLRKQPYVRKFKNGTVKRGDHLAEQAATLHKYNDRGYFARFVVGFEDFKHKIDWYMENEQTELF